jgi:adenosylcobyric acid synthase
MHGVFTSDAFRRVFLAGLGAEPGAIAYEHRIETTLDALADHLEHSLDLSAILAAARPPRLRRAA